MLDLYIVDVHFLKIVLEESVQLLFLLRYTLVDPSAIGSWSFSGGHAVIGP